MATDPRYTKSAREGGIPRPQTFGEAFREAKNAGEPDFEFPPRSGKMYSTKTAEEQGREIGATARGSGRSKYEGRTAANRDTASESKTEAPVRPRASLSDIPGLLMRGMAEGAERVPAGRGLGAAFMGAGLPRAVAGARAAGTGWRNRPPEGADPAKWKEIVKQIDEAYPGGTPFKKGGKVKAYAKGGSVRGAGCESRTKKTRYV